MPRLRILAGPTIHDLTEIEANSGKGFNIATDAFEGQVAVFLKGFSDSNGNVGHHSYFSRKERKRKTWSIQFQGRFLQPHSADDILVGAVFDRPMTLPWGFSAVTAFMQFMDPTLELDINSDRPWALSPLITTMPYFAHTRLSEPSLIPHFPPPKLIADNIADLPYKGGKLSSLKKRIARKTHFQNPARRKAVVLGPDDLITADFCHGHLDINNDKISIQVPGGFSFDMTQHWDGKPARFVCFIAFAESQQQSLLVSTTSGLVQGFLDTNTTSVPLNKWLGVYFAEDTSGANRWTPPKKTFRPGVQNATAFGPACMQGRADGGNGTSVQSEDCLVVNIISPQGAKNLPVYLYSYGGGFDSGASSDPKIDGSFLAAKDIVFVSYNYRLSLFGYPHASEIAEVGETQNFGLLDTRAAVEWVRDNIANFGGDPTKITLGGESVGAEMTNQYMTAFAKDPLIRGAVMQSADTSQPMWGLNNQISKIAQNFSCPTGRGLLDCLRKQSGVDLQKVLLATGTQFQPVTDNVTIFKEQVLSILTAEVSSDHFHLAFSFVKLTKEGRTARIPLLVGTNKDEGTLIVEGEPTTEAPTIAPYLTSNNLNLPWTIANLSDLQTLYPTPSTLYPSTFNATAAIWRDVHMLCLAHNLATQRTSALNLKVWRYRFDLVADNLNSLGASIGTFHGEDIRFVMGTWRTIVLSPPFVPATPKEIRVSDIMVEAWTNFVKDPEKGPQTPGWKQYDPNDPTTIGVLGNSLTGAEPGDHFAIDNSCAYWNTVLPIFPQV
ncbi:hypothetical protein EIP91_012404 [Steccherinum ochraceum]|uniref:Uncharacterized protein n=1 Tax=Steccherinum ochraceum TaxID=92696 RepID=A0A4R0RJX5_9APHY|nr:hypothetical protein EIP91_012404 [Steccherinum ochraceum]